MSRAGARRRLGEVDPCGSRQAGRRSGVTLARDGPVVGLADGTVRAFARDGTERWVVPGEGSAITLSPFDGGVLVGERSARGAIRLLDDGTERWRHDAAGDVGAPTRETRFWLPMVVDAAVADGGAYVAARRYERDDGDRHFESAVYAFAPDGTIRWRYETDAAPVALAPFGDGLAVAYNRCPGAHDDGLVVLGFDGTERWAWDPDRTAERRVGDVAAVDGWGDDAGDALVVASHADYRGYRIDDGAVTWAVDLGTTRDATGADGDETGEDGASEPGATSGEVDDASDGERVYTYPNHVHATEAGGVFLTGNTFPEEGRETDRRHPNEQAAIGYSPGGDRRWRVPVGGFAHEVATDGDRALVPIAQHFRDRDPSVHGWATLDVATGRVDAGDTDGILTAAGLDGDRRALVEEPVRYHDDGTVRGDYALRVE